MYFEHTHAPRHEGCCALRRKRIIATPAAPNEGITEVRKPTPLGIGF
jgi:hypothetical protein